MKPTFILSALALGAALLSQSTAAEPKLELQKGDRIALIGATVAERMQHHGWLETLIQSRFPDRELVFRNLGFSADALKVRQRTSGFGSPDDHLKSVEADVIFAFFGFNESFDGPDGVNKFEADLREVVQHMREQQYNGGSPARVVLFSPVAHEDLDNPDLPDGAKNNENLKLYTEAMAAVAADLNVPFVNLFEPMSRVYQQSDEPLTINGVHLNERGNLEVARVINNALFGETDPQTAALAKLRQAVLDKNFYWFQKYRPTDGYNVYGGRADLKYVDDVSNREVLQRELAVLAVMTANRDKRIWAVANGMDMEVDDSNTPPMIDVKTNKPGEGEGGKHIYLSGEEAIGKMKLAEGLQVNLVASEEQFPELANPVQMAFDTKGRLWVAVWPTYPHWKPKTPMNDKLLIVEDHDGDGKADKVITFADGLHNPTGFEFWNGGVLVGMAPDLWFLKDTDGDDKADVRERILHGLSSADTHHGANSFVFDPGGGLYFQEGTFHQTQVETIDGPQRNHNACVWRFEPRTWRFERYVPYNFANPHGHVFDRWGQSFVTDGTGAEPFHTTLFSGHIDHPRKHSKPPKLYQQRTRPCSATEILSSKHFPESYQGNYLVQNVIGFLGILQYKIDEKGGSFAGTEVEPILQSTDQNFRPADMEVGPDGALYFVDWANAIIGHMQHHLRDPSRDHQHGRIYRITHKDRPLVQPAKIDGEPIPALLDLLKDSDDRTRYRTRIELGGRETGKVIEALKAWIGSLDSAAEGYEHHMMEALWLHQNHNVVNEDLLQRMLTSPDHRARAAAVRVLSYWRDRVDAPLDKLSERTQDEHALVRLEAVRALSFFRDPKAMEIALTVLEKPMDEYLQFTLDETMKQLERLQ